jgi:hypothetical protein
MKAVPVCAGGRLVQGKADVVGEFPLVLRVNHRRIGYLRVARFNVYAHAELLQLSNRKPERCGDIRQPISISAIDKAG